MIEEVNAILCLCGCKKFDVVGEHNFLKCKRCGDEYSTTQLMQEALRRSNYTLTDTPISEDQLSI